jgi:hypothetical protein
VEGNDENSKNISARVGLVSEKMKDGILFLLRFGMFKKNQLTTFTRKTIIVTGKISTF